MRRPLVVAHRGGRGLAPENTLAACALAVDLGVDAVEVDVRLTADGVPIVLHDATLDRTTDGRGPVAAQPAATVRQLDATVALRGAGFAPEPPPTLAEVLALLRGRAAAHIELKGDPLVPAAVVEAVVRLLREREATPGTVLLSFDWAALERARALAPGLDTGALASAWPASGAATLRALAAGGTRWLGVRHTALTPTRAAAARAAGLRLGVWTVNRALALGRALHLGVDAITTDRPDRLLRLLASTKGSA
jgi:glycerophosphoryl diester phosphodiesterase